MCEAVAIRSEENTCNEKLELKESLNGLKILRHFLHNYQIYMNMLTNVYSLDNKDVYMERPINIMRT